MSKATEMLAVEDVVDAFLDGMRREITEWLHTEAVNQGDLMRELGNLKLTVMFRLWAGGFMNTVLLSDRTETVYLHKEYPPETGGKE